MPNKWLKINEWLKFFRKYNKREFKINGMCWNLQRNFDCQFKKLELFYKICRRISLALSLSLSLKNEIDQFIIFIVALVGGRGFFKESPSFWGASLTNFHHFEEHIPVQISFGKNVICNDKKEKIWTNQFKVRRYLTKIIKINKPEL